LLPAQAETTLPAHGSLRRRLAGAWRHGPRSFLTQLYRIARATETLLYRYPKAAEWKEGDLRYFEASVYSQNGEDGIIEEIFRRLKIDRGVFVEIGAEWGMECNCARLAREEGWSGYFIEGDPRVFEGLKANYRAFPNVSCINAWVTADNIEALLAAHGVPSEPQLLTIDIDGNDYWVWRSIEAWRPMVVAVEYNASYPPPQRWVMARNDEHVWKGTSYFGASLASLEALGESKGYSLVGTDSRGVNAFFVRSDLFDPGLFLVEGAAYHYSPPRYGFFGRGHRRVNGPFEAI